MRVGRALAAAMLLLATGGCGPAAGPQPIRVALLPYLSYAPFLLAEEGGDFRREKIPIQFVHLERNADATVALMAGRIDVTAGIVGAIDLNAMARGGGFRIVADKGHEEGGGCSFGGFVVPPGAGRPEPPGKFRVPRFSIYEFLLDRAMEAEGKDPASIDRVDVPVAVVPRGLATGALSGAAMDEPGLSRSLDAGDASLWKRYPEVFPGFQFAYVTFGRALLGPRRAEGVRFLRAYLRGVARYREGKTARNLAVIARRTGIPEKELARACWPAISANGSFDPATLDRYQEWCLSRRLIPRKLSLTEVADTDLARQAAAGLAAPR